MNETVTFSGELKKIEPRRLLDIKKRDLVSEFFLVLSIFYNDLKSLTFFAVQVDKYFTVTNIQQISVATGEYGGLKSYLDRLIYGVIYEFFDFIKDSAEIVEMDEFKHIYNRLNIPQRQNWDTIVLIARDKLPEENINFLAILKVIRNNLAFHYDQAAKVLKNGFIDFFVNDKKTPANEIAYYSTGNNMRETRYFFADAAGQRSIESEIEKRTKIGAKDFKDRVNSVFEGLNMTIMALMKEFIRYRKN